MQPRLVGLLFSPVNRLLSEAEKKTKKKKHRRPEDKAAFLIKQETGDEKTSHV